MNPEADFPLETVTLRDGTVVTLRAIQPDDAPRLQALHSRLSEESIYLRFLGQLKALSDKEAQRLADVDYQTRMAIVAMLDAGGEQQIVGVARYAVSGPAHPDSAEAAVVVEDAFQGRGLGTILTDRLVRYAQSHGIRAFLATVHHTNSEILRFIQKSGLPVEKKLNAGVWDIQIKLPT